MIITENVTKYEADYKHTYSDQRKLIYCERDTIGEEKLYFSHAWDPVSSDREYVESDIYIDDNRDLTAEEALRIITGE